MHILELLIELLLGESTFLQELRDMRQLFNQIHVDVIWQSPCELYQSVEKIYTASQHMSLMSVTVSEHQLITTIGQVLHWMSIVDLAYSEYIAHMVKLQYYIDTCRSTPSSIDAYILASTHIDELVRAPARRVIAYKDFITSIKQSISVLDDVKLSQQLDEVEERYHSIVDMIYTSDICIDNYRNIQSIQKTIDTFKTEYQDHYSMLDEDTLEFRHIVNIMTFNRLPSKDNTASTLKVTAFLFNDMLVLCEVVPKQDGKTLRMMLPFILLYEIHAMPLEHKSDHGRALLLDISHHMSILLEAPSAEKRKEWLTTLQQLQEAKFETSINLSNTKHTMGDTLPSTLNQPLPIKFEHCQKLCSFHDTSMSFASWKLNQTWPNQNHYILLYRLPDRKRAIIVVAARDDAGLMQHDHPFSPLFWTWLSPTCYIYRSGNDVVLNKMLRFSLTEQSSARRFYDALHEEQLRQIWYNDSKNASILQSQLKHKRAVYVAYLTESGWHVVGMCTLVWSLLPGCEWLLCVRCAVDHQDLLHIPLSTTTQIERLSEQLLRMSVSANGRPYTLAFYGCDEIIARTEVRIINFIAQAKAHAETIGRSFTARRSKKLVITSGEEDIDLTLFEQPAKLYWTHEKKGWKYAGFGQVHITWNEKDREKRLICFWPERRLLSVNVRLIPEIVVELFEQDTKKTSVKLCWPTDALKQSTNMTSAKMLIVQLRSEKEANQFINCILQPEHQSHLYTQARGSKPTTKSRPSCNILFEHLMHPKPTKHQDTLLLESGNPSMTVETNRLLEQKVDAAHKPTSESTIMSDSTIEIQHAMSHSLEPLTTQTFDVGAVKHHSISLSPIITTKQDHTLQAPISSKATDAVSIHMNENYDTDTTATSSKSVSSNHSSRVSRPPQAIKGAPVSTIVSLFEEKNAGNTTSNGKNPYSIQKPVLDGCVALARQRLLDACHRSANNTSPTTSRRTACRHNNTNMIQRKHQSPVADIIAKFNASLAMQSSIIGQHTRTPPSSTHRS